MRAPQLTLLVGTVFAALAAVAPRPGAAAPAGHSSGGTGSGGQVAPAAAWDVEPGPGGELGQWLVAGPVPLPGHGRRSARLEGAPWLAEAGAVRPGTAVVGPRPRATPWRVLAQAEPLVDLRQALRLRPGAGYQAALLGLRIDAATAQRAWLQVGHDDALAVWCNGQRVLHAPGARSYHADHWLVPLALVQGRNRLVLAVAHGSGRWRLQARLLGRDFAALGRGATRGAVRLRLPVPAGAATTPRATLALTVQGLAWSVARRLGPAGLAFAAVLRAPAGLVVPPGDGAVAVSARITAGGAAPPTRARVGARALGAAPGGHRLDLVWPSGGRVDQGVVELELPDGSHRRVKVWNPRALAGGLATAEGARRGLAVANLPAGSLATVDYHLQDLRRLLEAGDTDARTLGRRLRWVRRWLAALGRGRDPFGRVHGRVVLAYRSRVDGTLQPYSVYVPRGYRGRRAWPLVVMLHGMYSDHREGLHKLLGTWPAEGDRTPWEAFLRKPPPLAVHPRALVLAPQGYGDAFYRHAGERDVRRAIAEVQKRFRVDPARIVLVGHSMGGTGVLDLALRTPDRFAGVVAMAGYPTRWIHADVRRGPLAPYERFLAELGSPVTWAVNGRHLPVIAVHGTRDGPWKSRAVVERWKRLRQRAELKLFEAGHAVWRHYFDRGQVFADTAGWRRPAAPPRVTFRTPRLRWGRAWWVRVTDRARSGAWSQVDARQRRGNVVRVTTRNVTGLELAPTGAGAGWARGRGARVLLDGQTLAVPAGTALRFHRAGGRDGGLWQVGAAPPAPGLHKRPGLEGPLDDVHHGAVLVVVGTRDPAERAALARVGEALRRPGLAELRYDLKRDTQVTDQDRRRYHLILVGAAHANAETARYAARLPLRVTRRAVVAGGCRFTGPDVGALFIHPSPEVPDRYLVVLAGTTAEAVLRHHRLPWYLPDFAVFDRTVEAGEAWRVQGPARRLLAAGFFDHQWRLPQALPCGGGALRPAGPPRSALGAKRGPGWPGTAWRP